MSPTNQTPTRRLPVRAARVRGHSNAVNPTTPRPGGRVTRSTAAAFISTPSSSEPAVKRAASPDITTPNKRTRRQHARVGQYAESSDEDDNDDDDDDEGDAKSDAESSHTSGPDSDDQPLLSPAVKRKSGPLRSKRSPVKSKKPRTRASGRARAKKVARSTTVLKLKQPPVKTSSQNNRLMPTVLPYVDTGTPVFPPWSQLPYYVLLRIFEYAAGAPITVDSAKWLLDTSLVCHAFTEPALTALYRIPPLLTPNMAHGLATLLSKSPDQTSFNYRQKVKCLEMEAGTVVSKTFRGQSLSFKALLNNAPRLNEVYIWHERDQAPYRDLYENIKWMYPADMYLALGVRLVTGPEGSNSVVPAEDVSSVPKLRSWMWNRRMLGSMPLQNLRELHKFHAFRGIQKLVLTNFQLGSVTSRVPDDPEIVAADTRLVNDLSQSIQVLPQLAHLVVECSTAVEGRFLSQLPKSIEHLELICCWEVTAEHFAEYLLSHGNALRRLTLHHNQSLSLAWLPVLGAACPRLESLRMNMTYYSSLSSYNTSDPAYDTLLTADQVPSWPTTLQHLDLKNLRRWDKAAAEAFFQSLLDGAPNLLSLRHIDIKAMLDISIRERARLRDEWEGKLKRVFLREWVDPLPNVTLRSRPQLPQVIPAQDPKNRRHKTKLSHGSGNPSSTRRSGRIASLPSGPSSRASSTGRDMRAQETRPTYAEPDTDDDILSASGEEEPETKGVEQPNRSTQLPGAADEQTPFVQGLCTTVDIRFDNQKPVEHQFQMEDFLDDASDDPTDDDWSEDAGYESDHRHAW